jgi:hypothetical protein
MYALQCDTGNKAGDEPATASTAGGVYVGNLAPLFPEVDLQDMLTVYGPLASLTITRGKKKG